ncbi:MAG: ZIP family metal transporter [Bacilli bacterium]|nr:ZIP family metal transporter [Bacilli bacterium]
MSTYQLALLTTALLGVFILIGVLISYFFKKSEKIVLYSIGLAFGVIVMLIFTDLLPEIIGCIPISRIYIPIISIVLGFLMLRILDNFVPDHENKEKKDNLIHIGVMSSIALGLHNIIEGMAIYSSMLSSTKLGLALTLGVGFHNIPLGIVIGGAFYQSNNDKYKSILNILLVSLSTFVGGLLMFMFNINELSPTIEGILLSITLGMLLFIVLDELLPKVKKNIKNKAIISGITTGIIILLISMIW